jgi:hypothetical protein
MLGFKNANRNTDTAIQHQYEPAVPYLSLKYALIKYVNSVKKNATRCPVIHIGARSMKSHAKAHGDDNRGIQFHLR